MTIKHLIEEIPRLSIEERLVLLETITRSLRTSITPKEPVRESVVDRLYGAFKTDGTQLSDDDVERIRDQVLMEKHS